MAFVIRDDGMVLLLRWYFPCPHRDERGKPAWHVHYYVTNLKELADVGVINVVKWLDRGFWIDSLSIFSKPIVDRFLHQ